MLTEPPVKKTSYVVATKDRPQHLEHLLENVREFIRSDDELIIFDGGNRELSEPVIERFRDIVTLWRCEPDRCPDEALNKAILNCSGDIIVNLNDDDYFFPEGVTAAVEAMERHTDIDALVCGGVSSVITAENSEPVVSEYKHVPEGENLQDNWRLIMNGCSAGFLLVRRNVFAIIGIYGCTVKASDTDFMSRLILSGLNFKYMHVKYFQHTARPTSSQNVHEQKALQDRVIIAFRHKCWPEAMRYHEECEQALGLSELPGGKDIYLVMRYMEAVRIRCLPAIYLVGWILRQVEKCYWLIRGRPVNKSVVDRTPPVEPQWDGKIR